MKILIRINHQCQHQFCLMFQNIQIWKVLQITLQFVLILFYQLYQLCLQSSIILFLNIIHQLYCFSEKQMVLIHLTIFVQCFQMILGRKHQTLTNTSTQIHMHFINALYIKFQSMKTYNLSIFKKFLSYISKLRVT